MITLRDMTSISQLDPHELRQLIHRRITEITQGATYDSDVYGPFVVVEAGDCMGQIDAYLGRPFMGNFEWLVEWPCCYEAVFILSDDGYGIDMMIPKMVGIDADLLSMCAAYAVPAESGSVYE